MKRRIIKKKTAINLRERLRAERSLNDLMCRRVCEAQKQSEIAKAFQVQPIRQGHVMDVFVTTNHRGAYRNLRDVDIDSLIATRPCTIRVAAIPQFNVVINAPCLQDLMVYPGDRVTFNALREIADAFGREIFLELVRQAKAHGLLENKEPTT